MNNFEESTFAAVEVFLRKKGAAEFPHGHGRSLYDHLLGTQAILRHWSQPEWVCNAGALHNIYGSDLYKHSLVPNECRPEVETLVGPRAERLAYRFGTISRRDLFHQLDSFGSVPVNGLQVKSSRQGSKSSEHLSQEDVAELLVLHMANEVEQTCAPDKSPAFGLASLSRMGPWAREALTVIPPVFDKCSKTITEEDALAARDAYLAGLGVISTDRATAISHLTRSHDLCPWVSEPSMWLAYLQLQQGDYTSARISINRASEVYHQWGTAWDKRLSGEQWTWLIEFIASLSSNTSEFGPLPPPDPHDLPWFLGRLERRNQAIADVNFRRSGAGSEKPGSDRFLSYIASFARPGGRSRMRLYPGLHAQAWHESENFSIAVALENNFAEIRREILTLDQQQYAPERERIPRVGNWSVLFFSERGHKNKDVYDLCPITSSVIAGHRAIHTLAGMTYVSRLSPGTHIAAHRGPTNMRLRCHLPIVVPSGNCGIRVSGETRRWEEGKCLVFDDFLLHEAWNHAVRDRLVLIVDLWHPDLTDEEVALIEALDAYAAVQATILTKYWAANEKTRSAMDERGDLS